MHLKKNYNDFKENWGTGMDDKEKIEEVLRLLDKILRAKKEEFGFSYPEMNSSLVHDHFKKIKEILEK